MPKAVGFVILGPAWYQSTPGDGRDLALDLPAETPAMIRVEGLWVHQGVAPDGFDWNRVVGEDREERIRNAIHVELLSIHPTY